MGRSRLQYRSKHKGTLSENSRDKIRQARQNRYKNEQKEEIINTPQQIIPTEDIEEDEMVDGTNEDIFTLPKLYLVKNEYDSYFKEISTCNDDLNRCFPNINSVKSIINNATNKELEIDEYVVEQNTPIEDNESFDEPVVFSDDSSDDVKDLSDDSHDEKISLLSNEDKEEKKNKVLTFDDLDLDLGF